MSSRWFYLSLLLVTLPLTGCSSLVAGIISTPSSYPLGSPSQSPAELGYQSRRHCQGEICIPYLLAAPYQADDPQSPPRIRYTLESEANGVESRVHYGAERAQYGRASGTVLLLHGYRASKEAMISPSLYYRALGMKVILPDLFGHGDSRQPMGFGAKEHQVLGDLLDTLDRQNQLTPPVLVVGHSMGALAASYLADTQEKVDGALLQAPMGRFDRAAASYFPYRYPTLSKLVPDSLIVDGAQRAVESAGLTLEHTDLRPFLGRTRVPVLIFGSEVDSLAPYSELESLAGDAVEVRLRPGRNHPSLMLFSQEDAGLFEQWFFARVSDKKRAEKTPPLVVNRT